MLSFAEPVFAHLEVGAAVADAHLREALEQIRRWWLRPGARVDAQDGRTRMQARQREHQLTVKPARPPQRRVQRVNPVCRT